MSAPGLAQSLSWAGAGGATGALRLGGAMLLSLGVHAGAALLINLPQGPARAASGSVSVRLVAAPAREMLPPAAPAAAGAAPPAVTAPRVPAARAAAGETPTLLPRLASAARLAAVPEAVRPAPPRAVSAERRDTPSRPAFARSVAAAAPRESASAASVGRAGAGQHPSSRRESPPTPAHAPMAEARAAADPPPAGTPRPEPARAQPAAGVTPRPEPSHAQPAAVAQMAAPAVQRRPPPAGAPAALRDAFPPRPAAGNPAPEYPLIARRRGQQGRVLLRLEVAPDGTPSASAVVRSSGVAALDRAAREAVARWRFQPARRGGRAVAATVEVPVVFRLDERG